MRKKARELCFKVIYKSLFLDGDYSYDEMLSEENLPEDDVLFVKEIVELFKDNKDEVNKMINDNLVGYVPERVYSIDRAILDLAVTEIFFYKQTPLPIVINEAVELAKVYSTEKSYSFVNGLLKNITRK